jgi:uncharacterized NAD(P)/FAD-binding protein YdhS
MEIIEKDGPVVIIGAGAAGVLSAIALLRSGERAVVLAERDASWGMGPAYATSDPQHLLNVPASKLSVETDRPCNFLEWASTRVAGVTGASFLPRGLYGEYLRHSLDAAARTSPGRGLVRITGEATALHRACTRIRDDRVRVAFRDGRSIYASHVVLALGNPPPRPLAGGAGRVINDPWRACTAEMIRRNDSVSLIGTGLTAVDVALSLVGRGHRGAIRMVSRHGLLPRAHDVRPTRPRDIPRVPHPATARSALAWLRATVSEANGDWRAVFDAVRPCTNEIWRGWPEREQERFLRHAARYWEVHRHRLAPEVARSVHELVESGRIQIVRGTAMSAPDAHDGQWVINCTGPNFDLSASPSPLIRSLFETGIADPGSLGLGFAVAGDGSLRDGSGGASAAISVVGPLRRGSEWETTAIPEIRNQAEQLACRIAVRHGLHDRTPAGR